MADWGSMIQSLALNQPQPDLSLHGGGGILAPPPPAPAWQEGDPTVDPTAQTPVEFRNMQGLPPAKPGDADYAGPAPTQPTDAPAVKIIPPASNAAPANQARTEIQPVTTAQYLQAAGQRAPGASGVGGGGGGAPGATSGVTGTLGQVEQMNLKSNLVGSEADALAQRTAAASNEDWQAQRDSGDVVAQQRLALAKKNLDGAEGLVFPSNKEPSGLAQVARVLQFFPGVIGGIARDVNAYYTQQMQYAQQQYQGNLKGFTDKADAETKLSAAYESLGQDRDKAHEMALKDIHAHETVAQAYKLDAEGNTEASGKLLKANAGTIKESLENQLNFQKTAADTAKARADAAKTRLETSQLAQTIGQDSHARVGQYNMQRGVLFQNLPPEQQIASVQQAQKDGRLIPGYGITDVPLTEGQKAQVPAIQQFRPLLKSFETHLGSANPQDIVQAKQEATQIQSLYSPMLAASGGRPGEGLEHFTSDLIPDNAASMALWGKKYLPGLRSMAERSEDSLQAHRFDPPVRVASPGPNGQTGKVPHSQLRAAQAHGFKVVP